MQSATLEKHIYPLKAFKLFVNSTFRPLFTSYKETKKILLRLRPTKVQIKNIGAFVVVQNRK